MAVYLCILLAGCGGTGKEGSTNSDGAVDVQSSGNNTGGAEGSGIPGMGGSPQPGQPPDGGAGGAGPVDDADGNDPTDGGVMDDVAGEASPADGVDETDGDAATDSAASDGPIDSEPNAGDVGAIADSEDTGPVEADADGESSDTGHQPEALDVRDHRDADEDRADGPDDRTLTADGGREEPVDSSRPDASPEAASAVCGDGVIAGPETCDDHNQLSGDGCSATCRVEDGYVCPVAGQPCQRPNRCGDGQVNQSSEQCDDGNRSPDDGCSPTCQTECGWACPPGEPCRAAQCGDGLVAGSEQCDDGGNAAGDGCGPTCLLESMPLQKPEGWVCKAAPAGSDGCHGPTTCTASVCGDGIVEGSEQCDDMNHRQGDGCSPFCRFEPICPPAGGPCTTVCGDGLLFTADREVGQECDDGNRVNGDGCSSACKIEPGHRCEDVPNAPNALVLPMVIHDFKGWGIAGDSGGHPDFERVASCCGESGVAMPALGLVGGGVPIHALRCTSTTTNFCSPLPGPGGGTLDPRVDWFSMWYVDTPAYNIPIVQALSLEGQTGFISDPMCNLPGHPACTGYQFSSNVFFPIDNQGWGNEQNTHNFGFTTEIRHWFQYDGAMTIEVEGDDDMFVFINKVLAVDVGGTHATAAGTITLDPMNGTGSSCDLVAPGPGQTAACRSSNIVGAHTVDLSLKLGGVYEIAIFQAERHTFVSSFRVKLGSPPGTRSRCSVTPGHASETPNAN